MYNWNPGPDPQEFISHTWDPYCLSPMSHRYMDHYNIFGIVHPTMTPPMWNEWARQSPPFQHGPESLRERPPHTHHVDWHARYPDEIILSGPKDRKEVALTFDDGPDTMWTPRILSVLAEHSVKAEFNCVGERVEQNPSMLERIFRDGHDVENHSWNHPNFTKISSTQVRRQIEQTNDLIERITGARPRFFRPPYGAINDEVIRVVISLRMKILLWDVDSLDWAGLTRMQVAANVLGHTEPGSIILMHFAGGRGESLEDTVQALPYIIQTLRREGYSFKRVSELVGQPPYESGSSQGIASI